jgi:hypothetical protein
MAKAADLTYAIRQSGITAVGLVEIYPASARS